ncbi:hypothetical protein AAVH_24902, partial [Aphelenchoides avenae]
LLPAIIIPLSSQDYGLDFGWRVRSALLIGFSVGIWISECAMSAVSLVTLLRYQK